MSEVLAQCSGVRRTFGTFVAVDGVDLRLRRGEVVGLLGANGAGKTTLIRMLLGLLPVTQGEVLLFGEPPSRRTRRRIGYVPQGLGLYDDLTLAENMAFSVAVFGARRAGRRERRGASGAAAGGTGPDGPRAGVGGTGAGGGPAAGAAAGGPGVGESGTVLAEPLLPAPLLPEPLLPYRGTVVGALPLGIQRGAAFAEALAHRPDLLILDEPTSGVDPLARARLWETVAGAAVAGAGVLVTTHYMDEAGECDRLVVMAEGQVVAAGTAAQITGDSRVTVVEAASWAAALHALEAAGLPAALVGRTLRVPGAGVADVRRALAGVQADVSQAPATLEERFFELTLASAGTGVTR